MKTTCAYCGVGCGIRLSREGESWQLQGDEEHPANGGALCVKGASLLESLAFPDRLLYPRWMGQRIGWDEALDTLALTEVVVARFGLTFPNAKARQRFRKYSVNHTLQKLHARGEVERLHDVRVTELFHQCRADFLLVS